MLEQDVAGTALVAEPMESAFYDPDNSSAIMRVANFPDAILPLLQMESLVTRETATVFGCGVIVEIGCYDGRALEVARFAGTRYLGIDINEHAISILRRRIRQEGLAGMADAITANVLEHRKWSGAVGGAKPLYLLPFNLLGNFRDPKQILQALARVGGIVVISVFNSSLVATEIRRSYYRRCGVGELQEMTAPRGGVLFTGADGFYSQSFDEAGIRELVQECGATLLRWATNHIGHCATVLLADTAAQ
ncbi:hypothetical protein GCM10012275_56720 [Longimycelium tulufanense]|uniref:Uncharacterized protein n=1 Tax=Longimycelium tulufanense TaxID=907463 RepID=A0A8J3CDR6_9PSEU|nr:methyltransferase domain-containing protein [Longimycelium tulufanense]GGM78742.1 hypothetical protein GCM10012275_56720 [Longimycelium tulufanense]